MRATILFTIAALTIAATDARSEAWSVQKPDGSWVNTEHHPDNRPKPQPPKQIPGDKNPLNLRADKSDKEPRVSTYNGHWCLTPVIVSNQHPQGARHPACVDCGADRSKWPARPKTLRACSSIVHAKGKMVGQW